MRSRLITLLLGTALIAGSAAPPALAAQPAAAQPAAPPGLPLGAPDLPETRTVEALADGVTLTTIVRGTAPAGPIWTVTAGFRVTRAEADALAARVAEAGEAPRVEQVEDPVAGEVAGFVVRTGLFDDRADAAARAGRLAAAGISGTSVAATVEDGTPTSGPWVVRVLAVDPRRASLDAVLATGVVPGRETTSQIAARTGAVAAVNGGYFVIGTADGTPGDLAGISVVDGDLVSEAVAGRSALVLEGGAARVAQLDSPVTVHAAGGATREVDGLDRRPGAVRGCGGVGGDTPTQEPLHDVTCTDPSELIAFDTAWGGPAGAGAEVVAAVDGRGAVLAVTDGGELPVPAGGHVLAGTGDAAAWLREHARVGSGVRLAEQVRGTGTAGRPVPLRGDADVVNGGPLLVRDGREAVEAAAEGFVQQANPAFRYGFGIRRNPRTLAGVTGDGTVLLVTADGRAPGTAVGLSFGESAAVLRALGARDGLNLDGGGSTATVADGRLRTAPSDATGERPVGDALVVRGRPVG